MSKSTSCLSRLYIIVSRASSLRWCSCSTHRYALSLSFWRQVNSADACTWCHHDLVWEEASKVWYVHSPLHTLVMCRNKIIRRLTRARVPYRSYLLRCEWSGNQFLYHTIVSLPKVKKDAYAMPIALMTWYHWSPSFLCCSRHGRFLASWNTMVRNQMSTPSCIFKLSKASMAPCLVWMSWLLRTNTVSSRKPAINRFSNVVSP